jgi:hypothetical protein
MSLAPPSFSERLVPCRAAEPLDPLEKTAPALTPGSAVNAAPPEPPSAGGAAFLHFTESGRPVATVPEKTALAQGAACADAVQLSSASRFILRLIAAHDGRAEADVLARLIAAEGKAIGLSPLLARAGEDLGDDLADLPDFSRRAQNRFRADEPDRNQELRGLRR